MIFTNARFPVGEAYLPKKKKKKKTQGELTKEYTRFSIVR